MSKDKIDYPDLEAPEGELGDLKAIKRLPGMEKHAPAIIWGKEYDSWPIEKRLRYAQRLASSMNHAADILQKERNKLLEVIEHQEEQLKENTKAYVNQGDVMHKELGNADIEKQELYQQIVKLKQLTKQQVKQIRQLEDKLSDQN